MGTRQHTSSQLIDLHISQQFVKQNAEDQEENKEGKDIFTARYTPSLVFTKNGQTTESKKAVHQNNTLTINKALSTIEEDSDEFSKFSSYNLSSFKRVKQKQRAAYLQNSDVQLKSEVISSSTTANQKSGKTTQKQSRMKKSQSQTYNLPSIAQVQAGLNLQQLQNHESIQESSLIENSNVREVISFNAIDDQFGQEQESGTFEKCLSLTQIGLTSYRQDRKPIYSRNQSMLTQSKQNTSINYTQQSPTAKLNQRMKKNGTRDRPRNLLYF